MFTNNLFKIYKWIIFKKSCSSFLVSFPNPIKFNGYEDGFEKLKPISF